MENKRVSSLEESWSPVTEFTKIPNQLIRNNRISSSALRLVAAIMSYNPSYPSYSKLSKNTGLCRETISSSLKELVAWGIVDYIQGNSFKNSNKYIIRPISEWHIFSSEFELVVNSDQSKKRTYSKRTRNSVENSDLYESGHPTSNGQYSEPTSVSLSDCNNTNKKINERKTICNSNEVEKLTRNSAIEKMKWYLDQDYFNEWQNRKTENPGTEWFNNRLVQFNDFFSTYPGIVPDFKRHEFLTREINRIKNTQKNGDGSKRVQKLFEKMIQRYNVKQGTVQSNGNGNESDYDF